MKASAWNWTTPRPAGTFKFGPRWLAPLAAAVPWITVLILLQMMYLVSGTLTAAKGVLFELPDGDTLDGSAPSLVALIVPTSGDPLVFFDDARYSLGDRESVAAFGEHLAERIVREEDRTLTVLADRRIRGDVLSRFAAVARAGGVKKLLFANKEREEKGE